MLARAGAWSAGCFRRWLSAEIAAAAELFGAPRSVAFEPHRHDDRAIASLELGALAYVDKPFDLGYLKRVVTVALRPETGRPNARSGKVNASG